jgi:hypothetical protein
MRISGFARVSALALSIVVMPVLSGCGSNPFNPIPDPGGDGHIPPNAPLNDTVQNTMLRFEATYEFQDLPKYEALLSSDFRYTFSQASDPDLVLAYGNNWGKDDEIASSQHLFDGFTNAHGDAVPAASKIDIDLYGVQPTQDVEHLDSLAYYQKVVVSRVVMSIEVPGSPEPTVYNIDARHEFYLVRGDAALLDPSQEARTDRWYIRRWDDLSPPPPIPTGGAIQIASVNTPGTLARVSESWGRLKGDYKQ